MFSGILKRDNGLVSNSCQKPLTGERFGSWEELAVLGVAHTPRICGDKG